MAIKLKNRLHKIFHSELFQGSLSNKRYFEGWYFKHVNEEGTKSIAFIPGVSLEEESSHVFIQVIVSPDIKTYYFKFPVSAFETSEDPFSVRIGENVFSHSGCTVKLEDSDNEISINGSFEYEEITKVRKSILNPNIMGFFAYIPGMECNHGVLSMSHRLSGRVQIIDAAQSFEKLSDYSNGRGYIEKDWGTSFPSAYVWVQANHFKDKDVSFMCSIAQIPFGKFSFTGLIANLNYKGREYRFATYNRAKVSKFTQSDTHVAFELSRGGVKILCDAKVLEDGELKAPERGSMQRTIKEGLGGNVKLRIDFGGETVEIISPQAGIEIVKAHHLANALK